MTAIPSHAELSNLLSSAQQIASQADQILIKGFGKATASEKYDGTLVTETDRAVDAYLTSQITELKIEGWIALHGMEWQSSFLPTALVS